MAFTARASPPAPAGAQRRNPTTGRLASPHGVRARYAPSGPPFCPLAMGAGRTGTGSTPLRATAAVGVRDPRGTAPPSSLHTPVGARFSRPRDVPPRRRARLSTTTHAKSVLLAKRFTSYDDAALPADVERRRSRHQPHAINAAALSRRRERVVTPSARSLWFPDAGGPRRRCFSSASRSAGRLTARRVLQSPPWRRSTPSISS